MTKDEALRIAIEALEMHVPHYIKDRGCDALIACRQALEQPAQEPVAWIKQDNYGAPSLVFNGSFKYESSVVLYDNIPLYTHPAPQPAQEPVAIVTGHIEISLLSDTINKMLPINTELYTHPTPSCKCEKCGMKYCECGERK